MKETWKQIPNYEGYYSASNLGRIRRDKPEANTYAGRIMTQKAKGRYSRINLTKNGNKKIHLVHRLIASAFWGINTFKQINHKNGKRRDNRLKNLEWCSAKENMVHSLKHGLQPQGSRAYNAKLNEKQVLYIRKEYAKGNVSQQYLADRFKVSQLLVSIIIRRKRWRHI